MLFVSVTPRRYFFAVTDRRLILFPQGPINKPERTAAMVLPRARLRAGEVRKRLMTATFELTVDGEEQGLRFPFPLPVRADAWSIAALLNGVSR